MTNKVPCEEKESRFLGFCNLLGKAWIFIGGALSVIGLLELVTGNSVIAVSLFGQFAGGSSSGSSLFAIVFGVMATIMGVGLVWPVSGRRE